MQPPGLRRQSRSRPTAPSCAKATTNPYDDSAVSASTDAFVKAQNSATINDP